MSCKFIILMTGPNIYRNQRKRNAAATVNTADPATVQAAIVRINASANPASTKPAPSTKTQKTNAKRQNKRLLATEIKKMNHYQHPESRPVNANPSSQTVPRVVNAPAINIINDPPNPSNLFPPNTATIANAMGGLVNENNNDGGHTNTKRPRHEDGVALALGLVPEKQHPNYLSVVVRQGSSGTGTGMESSPSTSSVRTTNTYDDTDHNGADDEINALYKKEGYAFMKSIYRAGQQSKVKEHADDMEVLEVAHRQAMMQLKQKITKLDDALRKKDDEIEKATQALKQKDELNGLRILRAEEYISAYEEVNQFLESECTAHKKYIFEQEEKHKKYVFEQEEKRQQLYRRISELRQKGADQERSTYSVDNVS